MFHEIFHLLHCSLWCQSFLYCCWSGHWYFSCWRYFFFICSLQRYCCLFSPWVTEGILTFLHLEKSGVLTSERWLYSRNWSRDFDVAGYDSLKKIYLNLIGQSQSVVQPIKSRVIFWWNYNQSGATFFIQSEAELFLSDFKPNRGHIFHPIESRVIFWSIIQPIRSRVDMYSDYLWAGGHVLFIPPQPPQPPQPPCPKQGS